MFGTQPCNFALVPTYVTLSPSHPMASSADACRRLEALARGVLSSHASNQAIKAGMWVLTRAALCTSQCGDIDLRLQTAAPAVANELSGQKVSGASRRRRNLALHEPAIGPAYLAAASANAL